MNFKIPKSNLNDLDDQAHSGVDAQSHGNQSQQSDNTRVAFGAGDFVIYPAHGVGQILAVEKQIIAGANLEFFVIWFAKSKMTLRAPTRRAATVGMRKLSDPAAIKRVRSVLSQRPNKARGNWSRLAQDYEDKINSGNVIALAQAMRDLYRPTLNSGQSFSERQLYVSALDRLSGEVALVEGITEQEAVRELESLVSAGAKRSS